MRLLSALADRWAGRYRPFVVVPAPAEPRRDVSVASLAGLVLERLATLARPALGPEVGVLALGPDGRPHLEWDRALGFRPSPFRRGRACLVNAAALLTAPDEVAGWAADASGRRAFASDPARGEAYAVACDAPFDRASARLSARLVECRPAERSAPPAETACTVFPRHADTRSPAAAGGDGARPSVLAPAVVNTALAEILASGLPAPATAEQLAGALVELRARSAVPWIFNLLANEVEYEEGRPELRSLPPEVHLSLTSGCNIECGFCTYTHDRALFEALGVAELEALGFARHVHTLRLSSGLGEPTMVRELPQMVERLGERFPHLRLNFFTNGLALGRDALVEALVDRVTWINVSLNAATSTTWKDVCGTDGFDRMCRSIAALRDAKRAARVTHPLLYGSAVVNRRSLPDLVRLPELCRRLGVDRLTLIPFFALEFDGPGKLGAADALEQCRPEYDAAYEAIVAEAERHAVSLELPLPASQHRAAFGLEERRFHDFARIGHEDPLRAGALVRGLLAAPPPALCHWLWRLALVGRVDTRHRARDTTSHFLYPCLGPLVTVDFSAETAFRFAGEDELASVWNHPTLRFLRAAQRRPGASEVCDLCRGTDTRQPAHFDALRRALAAWPPGPVQTIAGMSR